MQFLLLFFYLFLFVGCTLIKDQEIIHTHKIDKPITKPKKVNINKDITTTTKVVKNSKVLNIASKMIKDRVIYRGGCWDYINNVFDKSLKTGGKKTTVFESKPRGPYALVSEFQPGDWLYFINLSYHNVQHSAIFVRWVDIDKKIALMISYPGENKRKPARYREYDRSIKSIQYHKI